MPKAGPTERGKQRVAMAKAIARKGPPVSSALLANDELTHNQKHYVENRAFGMGKQDAARAAGYATASAAADATNLEQLPKITEALASERAMNARLIGYSRQDVLEGLKSAIDDAKILADPSSQIAGWREIAKICGYYAPEVKEVHLTGAQLRARGELELLSDDELLRLSNRPAIEGQSTRIEDHDRPH